MDFCEPGLRKIEELFLMTQTLQTKKCRERESYAPADKKNRA